MFVDISLHCAVSPRPQYGTLVRLTRPLSLMFPYSRRLMIVLRRYPYGVLSDGHVYGFFVPLPPPVLIGFTHEGNIALEAGMARFCFSVLCSSCFTHGNKAP